MVSEPPSPLYRIRDRQTLHLGPRIVGVDLESIVMMFLYAIGLREISGTWIVDPSAFKVTPHQLGRMYHHRRKVTDPFLDEQRSRLRRTSSPPVPSPVPSLPISSRLPVSSVSSLSERCRASTSSICVPLTLPGRVCWHSRNRYARRGSRLRRAYA